MEIIFSNPKLNPHLRDKYVTSLRTALANILIPYGIRQQNMETCQTLYRLCLWNSNIWVEASDTETSQPLCYLPLDSLYSQPLVARDAISLDFMIEQHIAHTCISYVQLHQVCHRVFCLYLNKFNKSTDYSTTQNKNLILCNKLTS